MAKVKERLIKEKVEKLVVDTSVLIEGFVSGKIKSKEMSPKMIIIPEAVIAELESQANAGRETGYLGLEEIKALRELQEKAKFEISYVGKRQGEHEIKYAKSGAIDAMIREIAFQEKAYLITADKVNALAAEAKGIPVILIEFEREEEQKTLTFEKYFDATTMSLHIKENTAPVAKRGKPGEWELVEVDKILEKKVIQKMAKEIVEEATKREDGFIEIQREGSTIIQLGRYRTVITRPPFADGWEITLVRPVKKLSLEDYDISEKLQTRLAKQAEGVLIAGAPGMGKSTFTQALTEYYAKQKKIIKTIEAPRDLVLPDTVTQYALAHGDLQEIRDILLLSRPDYTIYDEMRNPADFELFADLRLAGVGMVGVVHATKPIDAIQRFLGKIEMGVIPHVVDTVVFIKNGTVAKTFNIKLEVKVPHGMTEADLARPVVVVNDFETGKQEFEIYSYGESTVVVPVTEAKQSPVRELAKDSIIRELRRYADEIEVEVTSDYGCTIYVPEHDIASIIGKQGKNIEMLEKMIGMSINVEELKKGSGKKKDVGQTINFRYEVTNSNIVLKVDPRYTAKSVTILVKGEELMTANVGKGGEIRIRYDHKTGKVLKDALEYKESVEVRV